MTLQLGGGGAITGCTSLQEPALTLSGLTVSGPLDVEKIIVSSGTAAAPSYTFSGDTDNGLYYAGTNSIGLATAGTNAILIDSAGKVGIGTSSPTDKLNISSGSNQIGLDTGNQSTYGTLDIGHFTNGAFIGTQAGSNTQSNILRFGTGGTEHLRIDSSGNVGIGTTSPAHELHVTDSDKPEIVVEDTTNNVKAYLGAADTSGRLGTLSNHDFAIRTNDTERARIDSSGRLLVGTSSARTDFNNGSISCKVQIEGTNFASSSLSATRNSVDGGSPTIELAKTRSGSIGGVNAVANNDKLGTINFAGADGTDLVRGARIEAQVDGTPGGNDMPGRLVFSTTADGASSPTERMRINSDGTMTLVSGRTLIGAAQSVVRSAANGGGASIFVTSFGSSVGQTGFIHAVEKGTSKYIIIACFKKDSSQNVFTTIVGNNGLTVQATNSGGTVALSGFTATNNVRMIAYITKTAFS